MEKKKNNAVEKAEKMRKKKELADFKRRYFDLYDDVKISYKEDW